MRFNDLFATVLSADAQSPLARATLWRQCVDLLAQYGNDVSGGDQAALTDVAGTVVRLRGQVPTEQKLAALAELGGRLTSARLVRLLLAEEAPVMMAAMRRARLRDSDWPAVIAEAGPLARSVLRQRTDLGPEARRALDAFGLTDLSLIDLNAAERVEEQPVAEVIEAEPEQDQSQIRRIVDRIERFTSQRQERQQRATAAASEPVGETESGIFSFITDADGVIHSVHGTSPTFLVGLRLATPSLDRSTGPDGQILGAFRRRGAFRDGRLTVGDGPLAGCWLVDGDPLFDQRSGRFTGYRGHARRAGDLDLAPYVVARKDAAEPSPEARERSASLRQLIHELRTPLSGVMGFAELIEAQLLGPVSDGYRNMAGDIVNDVHQLVDILDDLDLANRTDRLKTPAGAEAGDAAGLLRETVARIGGEGVHQRIALDTADGAIPVDVSPAITERMIAHFVRALTGCVGTETLAARARREGHWVVVEIDRPLAMAELSESQLFDSGFEHVAVNMDAPILGVGFALRLVRRLAEANRGSFTVQPERFALVLPLAENALEREAQS